MTAYDKHSVPTPTAPCSPPAPHSKVVFPKLALIGTCLNLEDFFKVHWFAFLLSSHLEANKSPLQVTSISCHKLSLWHMDGKIMCPVLNLCVASVHPLSLYPSINIYLCNSLCNVLEVLFNHGTTDLWHESLCTKCSAQKTVGMPLTPCEGGSLSQCESSKVEDPLSVVKVKPILSPVPKALSLPSWGNFAKVLHILRNIRVQIWGTFTITLGER